MAVHLIENFFNQDKTYTAIKTGIPTEDDGFTYEFGVYTHTNGNLSVVTTREI